MHFKAAVFDFNGTLVWDSPHHNRAFDIFLEKHGIALTDEEKTTRIYGKTNPDIMRGIFERSLTNQEIEDFSIEKELIYQQMIVDELHFAEGAEELFAFLKANSVPFTIATSADNFNLDFYFREMKLDRWFDRSKIAYNDGTVNGKPAPDIFLRAAELLRIPIEDIVIFEDSKAGIKAAENAGAGKIYVVDSIGDENLRNFGHDMITHFNQTDRSLFV